MDDQNDNVTITLKFGGIFRQAKNQVRRIYDGGKQRSFKFHKDNLYFHVLREKVELVCPWIQSSNYDLHYHICGTSPKHYIAITNEENVRSMVAQCTATRRIEVVVTTQENGEESACLVGGEVGGTISTSNYEYLSSNYVYNDNINQENLTETFRAGCRPLVGLDACHLKSKYLGVLLSATSLDGNNGLFTIAFAVAETESKQTWQWFLENLAVSFGYGIDHLAFISDMEKGLAEAMKVVFPDVEHRVCVCHLWKNLKKFFHCHDNQKIKSLIWSAANSYIKSEFEFMMNELSILCPQVHSYLLCLPYKWSKSDFCVEIKNQYNTNNMSESFNSWISEARSKPAVDLIDMIRGMLMEQRSERKQKASAWKGELVPYAEKYLREITTRKDQFIVRQMMCTLAEVEGQHKRHIVDIDSGDCTCGFWQVSGLPCIHATTFIGMKEQPQWHSYVHESYYVARYKMAYEQPISAMAGKDQWQGPNDGIIVGVPKSLRPRGRPKKRRIPNFLETV